MGKGAGTRAVNGGRCAQNGRPEPVARADQDGRRPSLPSGAKTGAGRGAPAHNRRRRLIMTGYMDAFTGGKVDPGVSG